MDDAAALPEVVSEDFFRLGDLPIMMCVLTLANGRYSTGMSLTTAPRKFDEEIARIFAWRKAHGNIPKALGYPKLP